MSIVVTITPERALPTYSVADAKAGLPRLIDRAMAGEEVIITRHGAPVAEIRPAPTAGASSTSEAYERLRAGRIQLAGAPSSVELLDLVYEQPDA